METRRQKKLRLLFDHNNLKKLTENSKVYISKNYKGYAMFARTLIKCGEKIAYYKVKNAKDLNEYSIAVYNKNGTVNKKLNGNLFEDSLSPPINKVCFAGYLINEPGLEQHQNCKIVGRYKKQETDTINVYKFYATEDIQPDTEICWYYGPEYNRNYLLPEEYYVDSNYQNYKLTRNIIC